MINRSSITKRVVLLLIVVCLVTSVGAYVYGSSKADTVTGQYYGMNWHPMWINAGAQNAEMDLMQQAGIKSVRIDAEWYFMEYTKGNYNSLYLSRFDNAVAGLTARGMQPLIVVTSTPKWVSGAPANDPSPGAEPPLRSTIGDACNAQQTNCTPYNGVSDYTAFLAYLMHRYGDKVTQYEIYNEPTGYWSWRNTYSNWVDDATTRAIDYTTLLKSAYTTVKAINPSATVLGGSLSGTDGPRQIFLKTMYAQGARPYFDVLSVHYYCDPPSQNWCNADRSKFDPETVANSYKANIYSIMQANGDSARQVWLTETGYNTYSAGGGVSEAQQADYLTRSYNVARTEPNITRTYWYAMDSPDTGNSTQNYYGILEANLANANALGTYRLKPAYQALKNLANPAVQAVPKPVTPVSTSTVPAATSKVPAVNTAPSIKHPSAATNIGSSQYARTNYGLGTTTVRPLTGNKLALQTPAANGTVSYRLDGKPYAANSIDQNRLADGRHTLQTVITKSGSPTQTFTQSLDVNTRKPTWENVYLHAKSTPLTSVIVGLTLPVAVTVYLFIRLRRRSSMIRNQPLPDSPKEVLRPAEILQPGHVIKPSIRN